MHTLFMIILLAGAFLFVAAAFSMNAPQAAVVVGLACFCGILARMVQADKQHGELRKLLCPPAPTAPLHPERQHFAGLPPLPPQVQR